jgi:MGT family glycosyltransferase
VHVTEGTLHVEDPFVLRAAVQGLGNLPFEVILTTGQDRDPAAMNLGPAAANIHLERWAAHSDLLPLTHLVVTTGGAGTVLTSLHFGVPLIVIPTEWEKPEMAQRVVEAGAGLRLSPRQCTPAKLRAAVERILGDDSFRRNAQRLAGVLAGYGGPVRAAELLEQLTRAPGSQIPA